MLNMFSLLEKFSLVVVIMVGKEWWFMDENTTSKGPQMGMVCLEIKEDVPGEIGSLFGEVINSWHLKDATPMPGVASSVSTL